MLKGIDPLISPDLLMSLASMGHGDQLAIVDRNYPAMSSNARVHRLDGVDAVTAIESVLSLLPLDGFVGTPFEYMEVVGSPGTINAVQEEAHRVAEKSCGRAISTGAVERFDFYRRSRNCFAILVTGEDRPYGCFILTKGVLPEFTP